MENKNSDILKKPGSDNEALDGIEESVDYLDIISGYTEEQKWLLADLNTQVTVIGLILILGLGGIIGSLWYLL